MSQYPPPFPMRRVDPLQPAKAAGLMMIILGCFALLGSGCALLGSVMIEEIAKQQPDLMKQLQVSSAAKMRLLMQVVAGAALAVAIAHFVLAVQVRRGSRTPTMVAIVLSILLAGWFGLNSLASLQVAPATALFPLIVTVAFGFQIKLLVRAQRAGPSIAADPNAQQEQYAQFLQQQQAYQQQYGVMPPINYMPYGPGTYNAPAAGTSGSNTAQTGWVWQPPGGAVPPPPPTDESHGQGSQG